VNLIRSRPGFIRAVHLVIETNVYSVEIYGIQVCNNLYCLVIRSAERMISPCNGGNKNRRHSCTQEKIYEKTNRGINSPVT
jgi:hypothetical protein